MPREIATLAIMNGWIGQNATWCATTPNAPSAMRAWATGAAAPPPPMAPAAVLSCFEIVMLAAAHAGAPQDVFATMYQNAAAPQTFMRAWLYNLAGGFIHDYEDGPIPAGNIVYFHLNPVNDTRYFHHVAISTGVAIHGDAQIISFFGQPNNPLTPVVQTSVQTIMQAGQPCYPGMVGDARVYYSTINVP